MKNINAWMSTDNHKSEIRLCANFLGCQDARTTTYFEHCLWHTTTVSYSFVQYKAKKNKLLSGKFEILGRSVNFFYIYIYFFLTVSFMSLN